MSKKVGRPQKAVRQEKNIGFYLTWDQYAVVQRKAERARVNISDYMRQVALAAEVKAKWTEEEREMVKTLIRMSVDLNRLAGEGSGILGVSEDSGGFDDSGVSGTSEDSGASDDPGASGFSGFSGILGGASCAEAEVFFRELRDRMDEIIKKLCHAR